MEVIATLYSSNGTAVAMRALDLVDLDQLAPGAWTIAPCLVRISREDAEAAIELLREEFPDLEARFENVH